MIDVNEVFRNATLSEFGKMLPPTKESLHKMVAPRPDIPKHLIHDASVNAHLVLIAIYGEGVDWKAHKNFFDFLTTTIAGQVLSGQALIARIVSPFWKTFQFSVAQRGIVKALFDYSRATRNIDLSPSERILELLSDGETDEISQIQFRNSLADLPPIGSDELDEFLDKLTKLRVAQRAKVRRNSPKKEESEFKKVLRLDFLANGLWCRETTDIVCEYFPDSTGKDLQRKITGIDKAFSMMKLSECRRKHDSLP